MALSQWLHLPFFQNPLKPFSFVSFSFPLNICSTLFWWICFHNVYTFYMQTFRYPPYPAGNIYRKGIFKSPNKYLKSEFKFKAQIFGPVLLVSLSTEGTRKSWFINKAFCSYHSFPFVGQCWLLHTYLYILEHFSGNFSATFLFPANDLIWATDQYFQFHHLFIFLAKTLADGQASLFLITITSSFVPPSSSSQQQTLPRQQHVLLSWENN